MIFQHTYEKVLTGEKTQTRRIVKPGEWLSEPINPLTGRELPLIVYSGAVPHERVKWQVGKTYAVQPGRGKPAVGRIRLTGIRCEDVRRISDFDVMSEGFGKYADFIRVWASMHDGQLPDLDTMSRNDAYELLFNRPAEKYQAWALEFEKA